MEKIKAKLEEVKKIIAEIEAMCEPTTTTKYSLEEVRGILADKARLGFTSQIKEILSKYGAAKLSELNPEKYEDILKDVKELENGN